METTAQTIKAEMAHATSRVSNLGRGRRLLAAAAVALALLAAGVVDPGSALAQVDKDPFVEMCKEWDCG